MTCLQYLYQFLYHPLQLDSIKIDLQLEPDLPGLEVEDLTAVSMPLLTIYDMAKTAKKTSAFRRFSLPGPRPLILTGL
jgi:molybdenum cofactor biosynthesis enzyme